MGIEDVLSVERLTEYRRQGLSYRAIARAVEYSRTTVTAYGRRVLPEGLRGQKRRTLTARVLEVLERDGDDQRLAREVAEEVGCSERLVWVCRQQWRDAVEEEEKDREICSRCGFREWEENPVIEGMCLWCRAAEARVDLGRLVEAVGWRGVLEAVG